MIISGGTPWRQLRRWRPMLLSISSRLSAEELQSLDEKARKAGLWPGKVAESRSGCGCQICQDLVMVW